MTLPIPEPQSAGIVPKINSLSNIPIKISTKSPNQCIGVFLVFTFQFAGQLIAENNSTTLLALIASEEKIKSKITSTNKLYTNPKKNQNCISKEKKKEHSICQNM